MIGVTSYADKTAAAVDRNRAALDRATQALTAHDRSRPKGDDADALYNWRRDRRDLEDRVSAATEALKYSQSKAQEAQAEAAKRAAEAESRAEEKFAAKASGRVSKIDALARELKSEIAALEADNERTRAYNARRGQRPYVAPAEERVRRQPDRLIPASYRDEVVWEDVNGIRPMTYRELPSGELVPVDQRFQRKKVTVCQGEERTIPSWMPESYASAIKLVDLEGKSL